MTDPIDPATISVGQWVQFSCPSCDFSYWHRWLVADGRAFGNTTCQMHDKPVTMTITNVEDDHDGQG